MSKQRDNLVGMNIGKAMRRIIIGREGYVLRRKDKIMRTREEKILRITDVIRNTNLYS